MMAKIQLTFRQWSRAEATIAVEEPTSKASIRPADAAVLRNHDSTRFLKPRSLNSLKISARQKRSRCELSRRKRAARCPAQFGDGCNSSDYLGQPIGKDGMVLSQGEGTPKCMLVGMLQDR